ncbi:MAG: NADP-dependent isocitrate dehydrogenase [Bacteroidetes bacterium]|nr:MAG: NADP-dependent isocitrate dehydrogenase [Bacteroidota bacterium]
MIHPASSTDVRTRIAVAPGDGIGPEIMAATLRILEAAGAPVDPTPIEIGAKVYARGETSGIPQNAWDTLRETKVLLKAPITTPQGGGYKSLNVTLRKTLGLFANVRPNKALSPYVHTLHPELDVVIIRENEEDLYAGIEHQQTEDVVQCLKLITRPGCERIVHYAFAYARAYGRKKVTCMVKDNIMKHTDGLFHEVFKEVAKQYPDIESESLIIDIGSALLAEQPERFDVVVTTNLYGDIISDIAAQIAGSVGMAGSSNIGTEVAMFEAIHGSAPDIAGKDIANPSGLLNAAMMMLVHLGASEVAEKIGNAWLRTLEDGIHTGDIYHPDRTQEKVGTQAFADAVIARLGQKPQTMTPWSLPHQAGPIVIPEYQRPKRKKQLVGCDVFIDWAGKDPQEIGDRLTELAGPQFKLKMITNRGVKVYPSGYPETFCTDHWRCRFVSNEAIIEADRKTYPPVDFSALLTLQQRLHGAGEDIIKTENLYAFDGERGFSLGQGE